MLSTFSCGSHEQETIVLTDKNEKGEVENNPEVLIFKAIASGDLNQIKVFIESKQISVDFTEPVSGKSLLIKAVESSRYAIAEYLMSQNALTDLKDSKGQTVADYIGKDKIFKSIVSGEELSAQVVTDYLIKFAIKKRNLPLYKFLIKKDFDPNTREKNKPRKPTPLISICLQSAEYETELAQMLKELLEKPSIDINLKYRDQTALQWAETLGHNELIRLLIEHTQK